MRVLERLGLRRETVGVPDSPVPSPRFARSPLSETAAHALRRARYRQGLTREEVAAACGVTWRAVGRWERGQRRPSLERSLILVDLLDLDDDLRAALIDGSTG